MFRFGLVMLPLIFSPFTAASFPVRGSMVSDSSWSEFVVTRTKLPTTVGVDSAYCNGILSVNDHVPLVTVEELASQKMSTPLTRASHSKPLSFGSGVISPVATSRRLISGLPSVCTRMESSSRFAEAH
jgi:hypothetical protein